MFQFVPVNLAYKWDCYYTLCLRLVSIWFFEAYVQCSRERERDLSFDYCTRNFRVDLNNNNQSNDEALKYAVQASKST